MQSRLRKRSGAALSENRISKRGCWPLFSCLGNINRMITGDPVPGHAVTMLFMRISSTKQRTGMGHARDRCMNLIELAPCCTIMRVSSVHPVSSFRRRAALFCRDPGMARSESSQHGPRCGAIECSCCMLFRRAHGTGWGGVSAISKIVTFCLSPRLI